MKLIVGLGNPGKKYQDTRHNIGFMCLDYFSNGLNDNFKPSSKFNAELLEFRAGTEKVILLKPLTFMNLSGESIKKVIEYYKIEINDMLVIYDDMDLDLGKLRIKKKGSSGGHNGIKSIINQLGTPEFNRLKFGISKDPRIPVVDYVLGKFSKINKDIINESINISAIIIQKFIDNTDIINLMNEYN